MFQFHQNNSQLLFHVIVSPWGAGAFSRGFTKILARQCRAFYCRAFSRALKIEKLKAPLFPGPGGAGDANDWCTTRACFPDAFFENCLQEIFVWLVYVPANNYGHVGKLSLFYGSSVHTGVIQLIPPVLSSETFCIYCCRPSIPVFVRVLRLSLSSVPLFQCPQGQQIVANQRIYHRKLSRRYLSLLQTSFQFS